MVQRLDLRTRNNVCDFRTTNWSPSRLYESFYDTIYIESEARTLFLSVCVGGMVNL